MTVFREIAGTAAAAIGGSMLATIGVGGALLLTSTVAMFAAALARVRRQPVVLRETALLRRDALAALPGDFPPLVVIHTRKAAA